MRGESRNEAISICPFMRMAQFPQVPPSTLLLTSHELELLKVSLKREAE